MADVRFPSGVYHLGCHVTRLCNCFITCLKWLLNNLCTQDNVCHTQVWRTNCHSPTKVFNPVGLTQVLIFVFYLCKNCNILPPIKEKISLLIYSHSTMFIILKCPLPLHPHPLLLLSARFKGHRFESLGQDMNC